MYHTHLCSESTHAGGCCPQSSGDLITRIRSPDDCVSMTHETQCHEIYMRFQINKICIYLYTYTWFDYSLDLKYIALECLDHFFKYASLAYYSKITYCAMLEEIYVQ